MNKRGDASGLEEPDKATEREMSKWGQSGEAV